MYTYTDFKNKPLLLKAKTAYGWKTKLDVDYFDWENHLEKFYPEITVNPVCNNRMYLKNI